MCVCVCVCMWVGGCKKDFEKKESRFFMSLKNFLYRITLTQPRKCWMEFTS